MGDRGTSRGVACPTARDQRDAQPDLLCLECFLQLSLRCEIDRSQSCKNDAAIGALTEPSRNCPLGTNLKQRVSDLTDRRTHRVDTALGTSKRTRASRLPKNSRMPFSAASPPSWPQHRPKRRHGRPRSVDAFRSTGDGWGAGLAMLATCLAVRPSCLVSILSGVLGHMADLPGRSFATCSWSSTF